MTVDTTKQLDQTLVDLGLEAVNPGAWAGSWLDTSGPEEPSVSPGTGKTLAAVVTAGRDDYERVAAVASTRVGST